MLLPVCRRQLRPIRNIWAGAGSLFAQRDPRKQRLVTTSFWQAASKVGAKQQLRKRTTHERTRQKIAMHKQEAQPRDCSRHQKEGQEKMCILDALKENREKTPVQITKGLKCATRNKQKRRTKDEEQETDEAETPNLFIDEANRLPRRRGRPCPSTLSFGLCRTVSEATFQTALHKEARIWKVEGGWWEVKDERWR